MVDIYLMKIRGKIEERMRMTEEKMIINLRKISLLRFLEYFFNFIRQNKKNPRRISFSYKLNDFFKNFGIFNSDV